MVHQTQITVPLRKKVQCVNCWASFSPVDAVWISESHEHFGDRLLGSDEPSRFRTLRFSPEGDGIDSYGARCPDVACPHCHLSVPRDLLSLRPLTVSVLGSPACGKSYFMAAMTWKLRRLLPQAFQLDFVDADHKTNLDFAQYEQSVFLTPHPNQPTSLDELIPKTELVGSRYNSVLKRGQTVHLPKPITFRLEPTRMHPSFAEFHKAARIICMYDNAGEHFLPGRDSARAPATRHLAVSDLLLFLFDPLQDIRFVRALKDSRLESLAQRFSSPFQQEQILREAAERIRRHRSSLKRSRPAKLVVVVTKSDEWLKHVAKIEEVPPYVVVDENRPRALSLARVKASSDRLRTVLRSTIPELVHAAEAVSSDPVFVPASALGNSPNMTNDLGAVMKPSDIQPWNVELPFLYGIGQQTRGLVATRK